MRVTGPVIVPPISTYATLQLSDKQVTPDKWSILGVPQGVLGVDWITVYLTRVFVRLAATQTRAGGERLRCYGSGGGQSV